jgi:hypothetical protein
MTNEVSENEAAAIETLKSLMQHGEDHVRLEAAQTVLNYESFRRN